MTTATARPQLQHNRTVPPIRWERVPCNLCGRDEGDVYHRERLAYFNQMLDFTIVRCRRCGLVYTNPRLSDHNATYLFGSESDPEAIERHGRAKRKVFARALKQLDRFVGRREAKRPLRLLDIGCGSGHFLAAARKAGYQVWGLEPTKAGADYAEQEFQLEVVRQDVLAADFYPDMFDVITLWDVLEHVGDPRAVLERCGEWLRSGGVLACRFPSGQWQKWKGRIFHGLLHWHRPVFSPTMHLYFFDTEPFAEMAHHAGLSVRHIRTTPLEANTDMNILNLAKRLMQPLLWVSDRLGCHFGNLEIYCRKETP